MAKYNYKFIFKHGAHRIADLSPKTSSKKNGRLFNRVYDPLQECPESKFHGSIGILERKHVHASGTIEIGKEANNIDEQALGVTGSQVFVDVEEVKQIILALTPDKAREIGIKYRSTLKKLKDRVREGEFKLDTKEYEEDS